ncbi:hypothetical protein COCVIDRAFT_20275 [Bipolaris victoriae FI3]|uniref:Uncharacterized protein n=1 Tax=Bipolaris victoriae (strain FI3) TaxID=930091 RepID=W7E458_BIPV3|nr:hypothetical protein COCVIDRAFT_20275 [Bipolaris victoriae FI3]
MSSQDTIPDDTLYQEHQNYLLVRDDVVYPASDLPEPAHASKPSGDKKNKEQLSKFISRETKEAVLHTNTKRKFEESNTEMNTLDKLKNMEGWLERMLGEIAGLISDFEEAPECTHKTLHKSGKLVRWADSTGTSGPNDDEHRVGKKARRNL